MKYPLDIEAAVNEWDANCGPSAIAAILDSPLSKIRPLLLSFDRRQCMNIGDVQQALSLAQVKFKGGLKVIPENGLVFIQWGGHERKPVRAQYRFTHWIAVNHGRVFDINLPMIVDWKEWEATVPKLTKDEGRGNGTYFIRSSIEVVK